ncbi:MAG: lipid-A-disaccharide synthase [Vulcanimicrobiaceae bacterium]
MRYFFSTGEASGEMSATLLARAISHVDQQARFEGIGGDRMLEAGFTLWRHTRGWGGMGPIEALGKIPKLYAAMWLTALRLRQRPPDLIVLIDFGAFNLRLAKSLRLLGARAPILYFFPPGAWLDRPSQARLVARVAKALVPFEHQRDFYRSLALEVQYFGHPLASAYELRAPRPAPPPDGGVVAILPGSRQGELRLHLGVLLDALELLRKSRPKLRAQIGSADAAAHEFIRDALAARGMSDVRILRSAPAALADVDAAWIASGTAVLEAALGGVPSIAMYILSAAQARIARRVYSGDWITIPNLVLRKRVVPELLQEAASASALADEMQTLLAEPWVQYEQLLDLRAALGPPGALARCAQLAVSLAKS